MKTYEAHLSDGHFGAQGRETFIGQAVDALIDQIESLADDCHQRIDIVINGDLIAGPFQRGDADDPRHELYPLDWEDILIEQTGPLFNYLRDVQFRVDYLMGNCERRYDMQKETLERRFGANINWGDATGSYALYNAENRRMITHMNLGEPSLPILRRSAYAELAGLVSPSLRSGRYARQDMSEEWQTHIKGADALLSTAVHDPEQLEWLDHVSLEVDDVHKKSCLENAKMERHLAYMPRFLRTMKNGLVSRTLNRVYLRTIAATDIGETQMESFSFGHIHDPFIYTRQQIAKRLGIEPRANLEYIVNSGTMVPLTANHGGDHRAHMLFWRGRQPELHQIFDRKNPTAKPRLANVGGETLSGRM